MKDDQNDPLFSSQGAGYGRGQGRGRGRGRGGRWVGEYSLVDVRLVEPALLAFLTQESLHGYALLEKLKNLGLGAINPSVVYRILRDFEEIGLVQSNWEDENTQGPPRRIYALTHEGKAVLEHARISLKDTVDRIETILEQINE